MTEDNRRKTGQARGRLAILGTRGIPATYGGFETFAEELASRLVARGFRVTVYCQSGQEPELQLYRGIELVHIPAASCGPLTTLLFDLRSLWHARRRYDVVYMLGYGAAPACFIPRLWGCQVWINVDGVEWARAKWSGLAKAYLRMMEWFAIRIPDRIIADADGIRAHLAARHRLARPCSVIAYGAPLVAAAPEGALLNEFRLSPGAYHLVVARIEPENHLREIIDGYVASASRLPLAVVGNHRSGTAYANSLLRCADERVRWLGGVYDQKKLQALRFYARAYCHGHSVGGTNPSLLEALGCGNLIIAHDNVYNREVVGEFGFYFRSVNDLPAIFARVEAMDEGAFLALRQSARSRIEDAYTWEAVCDRYVELLDQCVHAR